MKFFYVIQILLSMVSFGKLFKKFLYIGFRATLNFQNFRAGSAGNCFEPQLRSNRWPINWLFLPMSSISNNYIITQVIRAF